MRTSTGANFMHNGTVTDNFLRAAGLLVLLSALALGAFVGYLFWESIRNPEQ